MELETLRAEIDQIDTELVDLFKKRMETCMQVAQYKKENGVRVLDRAREREILAKVEAQAGEKLDYHAHMLYSVLFDLSRSYQTTLLCEETELTARIQDAIAHTGAFPRRGTVACQGVEGAYSQAACDKLFQMPGIMYFNSFENVFQAVEQGLCDFGILPIENSSNGSVNKVYDLMRHYKFHIVRSVRLHIDHRLLGNPGATMEDIKEIVSHEQAIGQCSAFLEKHPGVRLTVVENTAIAAKMVAESGRLDIAAISSPDCAQLYGLAVLHSHIQNSENNYTRFICIAKDLAIYPGADRVSLMMTTAHTPGALYRVLAQFASLGLNLTKLESRPIVGSDFDFLFYFDLEASVYSKDVVRILGELSKTDQLFVFLGSYSEAK
ncbi:chorismate mutase [Christensenellaceae bacterium OttesenSCG-928-M15]|nr:chorismate mutase [Christensenellaceae bacterium OttesenSCG-928-M15]